MISSYNLFEGAKYQASEADVQKLAFNIKMLKERKLSKLNRRLLDGRRNFWDTLSEHNFAVKLLSYRNEGTLISYEPDEGLNRPIDFRIVLDKITYWVQMKRLSNLQRENMQNKIVRKINNLAKEVKIAKFFRCYLSEQFSEKDVPDFIAYLSRQAQKHEENVKNFFPDAEKPKAIVCFWLPQKSTISSLTYGISGDMDIVHETGLAKKQIEESLKKSAGAFKWNVDLSTINLVAMDADNHKDIDICDAIFGTEFEVCRSNRRDVENVKHGWSREKDGFFLLPDFSKKVAGVIILKRKERNPVSDYFSMLYVNENFKARLNDINNLLNFDKIIYFKMRPNDSGNFFN